LEQENLHLDYLKFSDSHPTGVALIVLDEQSENTIVVVPGSNSMLQPEDMSKVKLSPGDVVLSQFEIPQETILTLFSRAKAARASTILNPAPAARLIPGLAEVVDYLVVNETELAFLSNELISQENLDIIHKQALKLQATEHQTVIVTLGAKGLASIDSNGLIEIPGFEVNVVDTTGAGDCFVGALAVSLAEDKSLVEALRFATASAAMSVQRMGASPSMPQYDEVVRFLATAG
jgi:ribokinase